MAELFGKGTGLVKGKGGSMHLFDVEHGLIGGYGIVGGHIPSASGLAYAPAYQETDSITRSTSATAPSTSARSTRPMNLAGLWGKDGMCPFLFIVENNGYAMGTSVERTTAMTDLAAKFDAYDIANEKVDGMDIFAVLEAADRTAEQVRETGKPYAIEALTYRFGAHGAADFFETYRTKEEVEEWRQRDPIGILGTSLVEGTRLDEETLEAMTSEASESIDEAVKFAEESPEAPTAGALHRRRTPVSSRGLGESNRGESEDLPRRDPRRDDGRDGPRPERPPHG